MRATVPPALWFGVMLAAYGWLHGVIHIYFMHSLGLNLWWLLTALAITSMAGLIVARFWRNIATETVAVIGSLWMGVAFIAFLVLSMFELISHIFRVPHYPHLALPLVLLLSIVALYFGRWTQVKRYKLPLHGLKRPVTIAQLSDLHIGDIYREGFLERVVQQTNELNPDIVVITGDLFDGAGKLHAGMIDALKLLHARHTFYVNGNHEIYEGLDITNAMVDRVGVRRLDDEAVEAMGVQFIGISYPEDMARDKRAALRKLVAKCDKRKPIVLLRHEPKDISYAASLHIDLQLSGHTHNGQIWPLNYLLRLAYERRVGLHYIGEYAVYINPGTGSWGPPMRLGSRSEITFFTLTPQTAYNKRRETL